jgi:hypothetical protein
MLMNDGNVLIPKVPETFPAIVTPGVVTTTAGIDGAGLVTETVTAWATASEAKFAKQRTTVAIAKKTFAFNMSRLLLGSVNRD